MVAGRALSNFCCKVPVALVEPNRTESTSWNGGPPVNPRPLIKTVCPPDADPELGLNPSKKHVTYSKQDGLVREVTLPPEKLSVILTKPVIKEIGVVAVTVCALTTTTSVAGNPPTSTPLVSNRLVPVIVIGVPPVVKPLSGLFPEMVGTGKK